MNFEYLHLSFGYVVFIRFTLLTDMRKPKLAAEIAKQLRKFHQVEIPGSKEPQLWNDIFKFYGKGLYMV